MAREENSSRPKIEIFFSYSHKDEEFRDELAKHLSILKRQGIIKAWYDRQISAGKEWKGEIDEHLNSAQIILLLVSSDFLASDYCYDIEMKRALERHELGEARVIPIILRTVDWQGALFSKLQALPKNAEPVSTWPDIDKAFTDVAKGIRKVSEEIKKSSPSETIKEEMVVEERSIFDQVRVKLILIRKLKDEEILDEIVAQEGQRELMKKIIEDKP